MRSQERRSSKFVLHESLHDRIDAVIRNEAQGERIHMRVSGGPETPCHPLQQCA